MQVDQQVVVVVQQPPRTNTRYNLAVEVGDLVVMEAGYDQSLVEEEKGFYSSFKTMNSCS